MTSSVWLLLPRSPPPLHVGSISADPVTGRKWTSGVPSCEQPPPPLPPPLPPLRFVRGVWGLCLLLESPPVSVSLTRPLEAPRYLP